MDIFYINLDRATDRRAFMEAQARQRGVALTRFRAVEPKDLAPGEYERFAELWERPLTANEIGLLRAHGELWKKALDRPEGVVVLEDDAVLSPRFAEAVTQLPSGFDLINLEDFGRRKFFRKGEPIQRPGFTVSEVVRDKTGSAAYHVSPQGARKLLALAETRAAPSDAFLFSVATLKIGQVEPAVAQQVHILAERGMDAGIVTTTTINKDRLKKPGGRRGAIYAARRSWTQLKLAGLHLRRLFDVRLRPSAFDDAEFRAILPILSDRDQ